MIFDGDIDTKQYSLKELIKTKKSRNFVEKLIEQAHRDKTIRKILDLENETVLETKRNMFKDTKFKNDF